MILMIYPGTKYGVPFPVLIRSSFGVKGARIVALLRSFVTCGWFSINAWIGGTALLLLFSYLVPSVKNSVYLSDYIGIDLFHLISFILIVIVHAIIIHFGIQFIKKIEIFTIPFLLILGIGFLLWSYAKVGSFSKLIEESFSLKQHTDWSMWPTLIALAGFWATPALNIPDFSRFVKMQKSRPLWQAAVLPTAMAFGIAASAAITIFSRAILTEVTETLGDDPILIIPLAGLVLAIICCNMATNVVSPANDFSNLFPKLISFKTGGYITCVIGIIIFPWKIVADPQGYIINWLLAYSTLFGALGGVIISDYYLIKKSLLNLEDLFKLEGQYTYLNGWNHKAFWALLIGILPNIPGFLLAVDLVNETFFPEWVGRLYDFAWFISFIVSFSVYFVLMKNPQYKKTSIILKSDYF